MTRRDLTRLLYDLGVPPELYRLDGSHYELAEVLDERGGQWVVFLSERGTESDVSIFDSEHDACLMLLGRVCAQLADRNALRVVIE